jgi:hypothetical protein
MKTRSLLVTVCSLASVVTGCVSSGPPAGMVPEGSPVKQVEQLSGDYCYFGPDLNVRIYRRGPEAIPFLHVAALGRPTRISVAATPEAVVFSYTGADGLEKRETFAPAKVGAVWRGDAFEVRWREKATTAYGSSEGFGVSGSSRKSRLFKLEDGRLIMTDMVRWKSATQTIFLLFESDVQLVALILDPDTGGCATAGRDPDGRSGSAGRPDLRAPACASRLESEVAAIQTGQGEDRQTAERLARATVGGLVVGQGDAGRFSVESPSGTTYEFEVAAEAPRSCVLRLYRRARKDPSFAEDHPSDSAQRPLPDCACNP